MRPLSSPLLLSYSCSAVHASDWYLWMTLLSVQINAQEAKKAADSSFSGKPKAHKVNRPNNPNNPNPNNPNPNNPNHLHIHIFTFAWQCERFCGVGSGLCVFCNCSLFSIGPTIELLAPILFIHTDAQERAERIFRYSFILTRKKERREFSDIHSYWRARKSGENFCLCV